MNKLLRPFQKHDWDGFAGAEPYVDDNGDTFPPLLAYVPVVGWRHIAHDLGMNELDDDCEWPMIVDNHGISIMFMDVIQELPCPYPRAAFIARALVKEPRVDPELLGLLGFEAW